MKTFKLLNAISFVFVLLLLVVCIYGFATDCPDTAGYVYCGAPETSNTL